jgi:cyclic pyranopterin phosphate synthase
LAPATIRAINENSIAKGSVLATARVAGIMAAKRCSDLIPLCHNIEIEHVEVNFNVRESEIEITSRAVCTDKTGIEMEALTAVSVAALTIYDMCKAVDKAMRITDIVVMEKTKEVLT